MEPFYPGRRFFARVLDINLYQLVWIIILLITLPSKAATRGLLASYLGTFIAVGMMLVLEPLWLYLFKTTPGKAIFGIRITDGNGERLSYKKGLKRTWGVVSRGLGFNIPFYALVCLWQSYQTCFAEVEQPWDMYLSYKVKDTKTYRIPLFCFAVVVIFGIAFSLGFVNPLPPNRGDLTVTQFTENYNHYVECYGEEYDLAYLNEEVDSMRLFYAERPEYRYTLEDGHIKSIALDIELKDRNTNIDSYVMDMTLAALAFAGAEKEVHIFSAIPRRIENQISSNRFSNFTFTEAGITFKADTEYYGYQDYDLGFLVAEEESEKYSYKLHFTVTK